MAFSFAVIQKSVHLLIPAAGATVAVSLSGLAIGFVIATAVCTARLSRRRGARMAGTVYVSFFRGVPMLVQLLLFYYFLPSVGLDLPALVAAVGTLALCTAAYQAEILRGGFLAVPRGEVEAARVLGLSAWKTLLRIQLPLAVRATLPSLINEMIMLLKASSLISVVGVAELTRTSQNIAASTFRPLEIYIAAGAIYFLINGVLALGGRLVERRLARGRT